MSKRNLDQDNERIKPISKHYPLRESQINDTGGVTEDDDITVQDSQGDPAWNPSTQSDNVASSSSHMSNQIPKSDTHDLDILVDIYEPIEYPKLDYELAHLNRQRLLTAYMVKVKFHNTKPKVDR